MTLTAFLTDSGAKQSSPPAAITRLVEAGKVDNACPVDTSVGPLTLVEKAGKLTHVKWGSYHYGHISPLLEEARRQIAAYFRGELRAFELPLALTGSPFQRDVCRLMLQIPYGETWTYGDIAKRLKTSAQPVGGACGRNPLPIIIPCHRVMGANDKWTGFSGDGGIQTKQALLLLEGWRPKEPDLFS